MALRLDGVDDNIKHLAGAISGDSLRPLTAGIRFKRNNTAAWNALLCVDTSGAAVRADLIELDTGDDWAFWNGQTSSNDLSGSVVANITDTTNWVDGFLTWSTANAVRYHWRINAGAWSHGSIADTAGAATTFNASDLWVVGTTAGGDDAQIDVTCWGAKLGTPPDDATVETTFANAHLGIAAWDAFFTGADSICHGYETAATSTDRTGNGGNETSRSGCTLVADSAAFDWGGAAVAKPKTLALVGVG